MQGPRMRSALLLVVPLWLGAGAWGPASALSLPSQQQQPASGTRVHLRERKTSLVRTSPLPRRTALRLRLRASLLSAGEEVLEEDRMLMQVFSLVNQERAKGGLPPLSRDPSLDRAALLHAEDMHLREYFEHDSPEGVTATERVRAAGYPLAGSWVTGENIAHGQRSPRRVVREWMESPLHRENILSREFRDTGLGRAGDYWVQEFAAHEG